MVVDQGKDSFILLIDPEFALGHIKEDYLGFIRAEINEFFFWLTVGLNSLVLMGDRCLSLQPGKIPVYDGGLAYTVDDAAWTGPRLGTCINHWSECKGDCRGRLEMRR